MEDRAVVEVLREKNWSRVDLAREVAALREEMNPPPVCAGSGTIMVDLQPVVASIPTVGLCGICGQTVPLMYDGQTLAPHPYQREEGR